MDKLLTLEQAAVKIGVSKEQVSQWIKDGVLGVIFPTDKGIQVREIDCIKLRKLEGAKQ